MVALFVFLTFVAFIAADLAVNRLRQPATVQARQRIPRVVLSYPAGLFFSKGHTWAVPAGKDEVHVGLGDFISNLVGNIDRLEVTSGEIKAGRPLFTIHQKDKALTLNSPVNGEVSEVNEDILSNPNSIKERPVSNQWVVALKTENTSRELNPLQNASEAKGWIQKEAARFVDAYSRIFARPGLAPSLADGGTLIEGALSYGDKDTWEKFQEEFL